MNLGIGIGISFSRRKPQAGAPKYHLSMNGTTSDKLVTPSLTFDEVIFTLTPHQKSSGAQYYVDLRDGTNSTHFFYANGVNDTYNGFSSLYVDGALKGNNIGTVPRDAKTTIRLVNSAAITRALTFAQAYNATFPMQMDLYDIQIKSGGVLVAHYDLTKGNVQDQSGNGHDATLSGGTWVAE